MNIDWSPLWISLKTSVLATIITFILGIYVGYLMYNYKGKLKGVIDGILTLTLVLPPTVIGFFLLIIFGKNGFIGEVLIKLDRNIIFTWSATVVSAIVVSFPIMYRACRSAFEQIDNNLIYAGKTLGLSKFEIFKNICFPLALPGIIGGTVLAFARAMGEFGATLMLAGNIPGKTQTMPIAIFFAVESGQMDIAILWVIAIIFVSIITILLLNYISEYQQLIIGKRRK
ncbi:MAG: molybdate ABC transporter permease subunit [Romboutsia sp.]|uniref:molybdate ABC transporter permease subunit n=1 Tax=Romboutsia sp. TaxID=1965302 RepID=UPI003F36844B